MFFFRYTGHPSGNSQILLLSHTPVSDEEWSILSDVCAQYSYAAYAKILADIDHNPRSFFENLSEFRHCGDVSVALGIREGMAADYTVLIHAAQRCYREGLYQQSQWFLGLALRDYGAVAVNGWLLQGKVCKALSDWDGAMSAFLKGYAIAPHDELLLYELGVLLLKRKSYDDYIAYAKLYLRYRCKLPEVWETVVTILVCMSMRKQQADVVLACDEIMQLAVAYPGLISEAVLAKLATLKDLKVA